MLTALPPGGKREHRLGKRGDRGNNTELKRAVYLRRLVGTLDARNARGEIDEALGDNHGRGGAWRSIQ